MKTQGNINNGSYMWRPNDNSVSTKIKYDLEAEHWVDSVNSAQRHANRGASASEVSAFAGLIFGTVFSILYLVWALVKFLFGWIFKDNSKPIPQPREYKFSRMTEDEMSVIRGSLENDEPFDLYGDQTLDEYGWYN